MLTSLDLELVHDDRLEFVVEAVKAEDKVGWAEVEASSNPDP